MVVDWRRRRLHDKDLFAPHRLIQLHHHLAVGEPIDRASAALYPKLPSDGARQTGIGASCENRKRIAQVPPRAEPQPGLIRTLCASAPIEAVLAGPSRAIN